MDGNCYAIVNAGSGITLDHYFGNSIQAYNSDTSNPHYQWVLRSCGDGWFGIVCRATGMALDHYCSNSIQAFNDDISHHHHP